MSRPSAPPSVRRWSDDERQFLTDNSGQPVEALAEHLNRTPGAISVKLYAMGFKPVWKERP